MSLPPSEIPQGAIRFNTDSQRLEFYAQGQWWIMSTDTPNLATTNQPFPGARGLTGGGYAPSAHSEIMFWNIASLSNGADFGDLTENKGYTAGCASRTRAVWGGGTAAPVSGAVDTLEFVTIASTGNGTTFGELVGVDRAHMGAAGSETRGIYAGGETPTRQDIIEFITISSTGNSVDFGDLPSIREAPAALSSPTRTVMASGFNPSASLIDIQFITTATKGNSQYFGDLPQANGGMAAAGNATRGLFGGGSPGPSIIDYLTIATQGNAVRFGDLTVGRRYAAAASSQTRYTCVGGLNPASEDRMDYVEIASEGNATDFSDLNNVNNPGTGSGCSNAHGGL